LIELKGLGIAGIYLLLKSKEQELDSRMTDLTDEIESYLYNRLSIQEMEELQQLYTDEDEKLSTKI
jgi:hypothetical protein